MRLEVQTWATVAAFLLAGGLGSAPPEQAPRQKALGPGALEGLSQTEVAPPSLPRAEPGAFVPEGVTSALRPRRAPRKRTGMTSVIVEVGDRTIRRALASRVASLGGRVVRSYRAIPFATVEIPTSSLAALQSSLLAGRWQLDALRFSQLAPSPAAASAPVAAPPLAAGASGGQTIAILAEGFQLDHPAYADRIVSEACFSGGSTGYGSNCPDGVPSVLGRGSSTYAACVASRGASGECSAGTHLAGIAAGDTIDGAGADLVLMNVFSSLAPCGGDEDARPCVGAWDSDVLSALDRVHALRDSHGIAAVLLSFGSGLFAGSCDEDHPAYAAAADALRSSGIALIAPSGDQGEDGRLAAPACVSGVISVGASTEEGAIAGFGNTADGLDFVAHGEAVVSALPVSRYGPMSGTAAAAAQVARAWAAQRRRDPGLSGTDDVEAALHQVGASSFDEVGRPLTRVDEPALHAFLSPAGPVGAAAAPVTVAPVGTVVANDGLPTYTWNAVGGETWYQLHVREAISGTVVIDRWYSAASVCSGAVCSVRPTGTADVLATAVDYQWYVRSWGPGGYSGWSSALGFRITASLPGAPGGLSATLNGGDPRFQWNDDGGVSSWYEIVVKWGPEVLFQRWIQRGTGGLSCNGATCTVAPGWYLSNGGYTAEVRGYGPGGYGPRASLALAFNLPAPLAPGSFSVFDYENFGNTYGYSWLIFQWSSSADASRYLLEVAEPGGSVVLRQWYRGLENCSGSICQAALPNLHMKNVTYTWRVQAWGAGGFSPYGSGTYTFAMTPATVAPTAPTGTITTPRPTFTISKSLGSATWYELLLKDAGGLTVLQQWFQLNNCSSPCSRSTTPQVALEDGSYTWQVRGWGPAGFSALSSSMSFTVALAPPGTPALVAPASGTVVSSTSVTFSWSRGVNAVWHDLEVRTGGGTTVESRQVPCWSSICSTTVALAGGQALDWRVRAWNGLAGQSSPWTTPYTLTTLLHGGP